MKKMTEKGDAKTDLSLEEIQNQMEVAAKSINFSKRALVRCRTVKEQQL